MFLNTTKILDNHGLRVNLCDIQKDMFVSGWDFTNNRSEVIKVIAVILSYLDNYIEIDIQGTIIKCAFSSVFYTERGWAAYDVVTAKKFLPDLEIVQLSNTDKILNVNNEYISITSITERNEELVALALDTDDNYDTFIVEGYVVHNLPSIAGYLISTSVRYSAFSAQYPTAFSSVSSFTWQFRMTDNSLKAPGVSASYNTTGFSYPAFTYTKSSSSSPSIDHGEYTVSGTLNV